MKMLFVPAMVIGLTFTAVTGVAQTPKEVMSALKKLQAKCQAEVVFKDYRNAVDDAKFFVNSFLESTDAKKNGALTDSVKKLMAHYDYAGTLLEQKGSSASGLISANTAVGKQIKELYPQLQPNKSALGEFYFIDSLVQMICKESSKELETAANLSATAESELQAETDHRKKEIDQLREDNAKLKQENEQLSEENTNLKKQLELLKPKRK